MYRGLISTRRTADPDHGPSVRVGTLAAFHSRAIDRQAFPVSTAEYAALISAASSSTTVTRSTA